MVKTSRVDQIPMLLDVDTSVTQSVELSRVGSSQSFALRVLDDEDEVAGMYGATGASTAVKGEGHKDVDKHEHLMKSGPMGRCDDPYCTTCPSYFGTSNKPMGPGPVKYNVFVGRASNLRNRAASWSRSWLPGIYNPHTKIVQRWNKIFCISSLIAIFIDPLFFFLLRVEGNNMCLVFDNTAAVAVTVFRSLTDTIHVLHICLQFRLAYVASSSRILGAGELEDNPKKIAVRYLQRWFIVDLFTALPLPQFLIWTVVKKMLGKESGANFAKNTLRVVVLLQNIPRGMRFFPLLSGQSPGGFVFETAWANFFVNLLMYLLAGHIVGACWYLFGVQRVNQCMENVCKFESSGILGGPPNTNITCKRAYLDCGSGESNARLTDQNYDPNYHQWLNYSTVGSTCLTSNTSFAYGIYMNGVQVILENKVIDKYIYSTFWGFQQISTFAGNQIPSTFVWEVLFTMGIVGLGLLLFALLIGSMQNFLQSLGRRKLEMQLLRYDTEAWMRKRRLPALLRRRVKQAGRHRWAATMGVEERDLLSDLPEDLQRDIQRYLCLELVKKVRLFELLEDHVLDAICERLYQKLYIEQSEVFRVKAPVERMLFIVRGNLESSGEDGSIAQLKEGDFCGEELLSWYIDVAGVSKAGKKVGGKKKKGKHPYSSRTVKCLTTVEAFSLDSAGLEYITTHYKAAFRSPRVQGVIRYLSHYWRSLAATRIQKSWRAMKARQAQSGHSTGPRNRSVSRFRTINSRV